MAKKADLRKKTKLTDMKSSVPSAWVKHDGLYADDPNFNAVMAEVAKKRKTLKA